MSDLQNYVPGLGRGVTIGTGDIDGTLTTANFANSGVTGVKTSLTKFYGVIAVPVGTPTINVFGSATAPTSGTITGFYVASASTTAGSTALMTTTAGTIATILYGTQVGYMVGTTVINAAFAAGDTVILSAASGAGSGTAYITFVTAS